MAAIDSYISEGNATNVFDQRTIKRLGSDGGGDDTLCHTD